eukprot:3006015-Rhodomonas_salina.2
MPSAYATSVPRSAQLPRRHQHHPVCQYRASHSQRVGRYHGKFQVQSLNPTCRTAICYFSTTAEPDSIMRCQYRQRIASA